MESSVESSQSGGAPKAKSVLAPKPLLAPKPFSLQKNNTIRSIHAPKTVLATSKAKPNQTGKSEVTGDLKATLTPPAQKPRQTTSISTSKQSSVSVSTKNQPSKVLPQKESTLDTSARVSSPPSPATQLEETPKSESVQKDDVIQTNHNSSRDAAVTNSEQKDGKNKQDETKVSDPQTFEEVSCDISSTTNSPQRWGSTRRRLPMELTSKFQSGAPLLPPKPTLAISKSSTKNDANKPAFSNPEQNQTVSELPNSESDAGGLKEDHSGGNSIKRRISLLFDPSSRPEVMTKREDPEIMNGIGAVKERIKNWASETVSEGPKAEKNPPAAPKTCSKSYEPAAIPAVEETPETPTAEVPGEEEVTTQPVDTLLKVSPAEQPTETQMETPKDAFNEDKSAEVTTETGEQSKAIEGDVQLQNHSRSTSHTAVEKGDAGAKLVPTRDKVKRRSVRFGTVVSDDGGPPIILGSESESSAEEEEKEESPEEKPEEDVVSVPVYRKVGILQRKDERQRQEEKKQKHVEFIKRQKEDEEQQARLMLEEELKPEEGVREKEKAKESEELRFREEEMERQSIQEEERRQLIDEEREMERLRDERIEKERQTELLWQRQREEEREKKEQKEKRPKHVQEDWEKQKLKEEEGKEVILREDGEMQREEEERLIPEHKEHLLEEKPGEEEMSKDKQREENCDGVKEEEVERKQEKELELMKQRQEEEERERMRQMEERLRQEEWEKEQLREEAEERGRRRKLQEEEKLKRKQEEERQKGELERKIQQEKEEEVERMRQIEKQREDERREEERKRQTEKERGESLERKMQEEVEKQVDKLEKNPKIEEKGERKELELTMRVEERTSDKGEQNLISFDSEDVIQKSESVVSPSANSYKPTESVIDVVYDDFSVRKPLLEVDYDDFSVKPKTRGSQAKEETVPVRHRWADEFTDKEEVLVSLDVRPQENKQEQVEKEQVHSQAQESPQKEGVEVSVDVDPEEGEKEEEGGEERPAEEQRNSVGVEVEEEEEEEKETENVEQAEREEEHREEEDNNETEANSFCTNDEDKETDALTDGEPHQQDGVCKQACDTDSSQHIPDHIPEVSSDTVDSHREADLPPLPESFTPLLDTSAQRSKADLGKKRIRARPSRSLRAGSDQMGRLDWRVHDSTEEKEVSSRQSDSDSEEDQPKPKAVCSPPSAAQRVPVFPGMSPAALIAQIKKRTGGPGGGGEETEEDKAREKKERQNEEVAPSPSQLSQSPRSAAKLAGAALVLPPLGGKDGGAASSPAWLKELRSKKRMTQNNGET